MSVCGVCVCVCGVCVCVCVCVLTECETAGFYMYVWRPRLYVHIYV